MPAPYSNDLRTKVIEAHERKEGSQVTLAHRFGVSIGFIKNLLRRFRLTGRVDPLPHGGGNPPIFPPARQEDLRRYIAQHSDATLAELREWSGEKCSLETIAQTLKRMGLVRKKKTLRAAEQDRADVRQAREDYREQMAQVSPNKLVFVDESGAKTTMTREYGRAPKGVRVQDTVPGGHWQTTTMIGSLRGDGATTCMALEGTVDQDAFLIYVEEVLCPTLRPGDMVIWDNLSSHGKPKAVEAIEKAQARVCPLPSYSSDFNPIEPMWSKIKQYLKGQAARTEKALVKAIGQAFDLIRPSDAQGWFKLCGYGINQP